MRWAMFLVAGVACGPETILAPPHPSDEPPTVLSGESGCDGNPDGESWIFRAQVDDPDGIEDVVEVDAFVYDETTDTQIDGFPLEAEDDPHWWSASVSVDDTALDCAYLNYSVDFVATDSAGASGVITAWASPLVQ